MMFKLEGQLIRSNPEFQMEDRLLLHKIDLETRTVEIGGKVWPIRDLPLSTLLPDDPYALTAEETEVLHGLRLAFLHSRHLHKQL